MVLISNKYKYIFIHIPKTGGTTVKKTLPHDEQTYCKLPVDLECFNFDNSSYNNNYHMTYSEFMNKHDNHNNHNNYFVFTFVRNPYDRLYSTYLYSQNICKMTFKYILFVSLFSIFVLFKLKNKILNRIISIIFLTLVVKLFNILKFSFVILTHDFNHFVKYQFKNLTNIYPHSIISQYEYISQNGKNMANFVGKEETFDHDLAYIMNKFNINKKIVNDNVITKKKKNQFYKYINKYNRESIDFVNNYYRKDFEEFNYDML